MKLSEAAQILNGTLQGPDVEFQFVNSDTRKINPGELFIALQGPNFNGHDFIAQAEQKQAIAALVSQGVQSQIPTIQVADTLKALGQLAAHRRQQVPIPVIGLTGSCGKTTTKAMITSILKHRGSVLSSEGTFNNAIGVPLTLMRLTPQHEYAVIEMGANHFGEIRYVTHITKPTVALITNAAPVHLDGFGDVEGVSRAKGEIYEGLADDGAAIINADDHYADYWRRMAENKRIWQFGIKKKTDVTAEQIQLNEAGWANFVLSIHGRKIPIQLPVLGRHNVMNALAAATSTAAVGATLKQIKAGLESFTAVSKRLVEYKAYAGAHLIDDSYNANPLAFQCALEILAQKPGETILVLGDMGELADKAEQYHRELGEQARELGIQKLYAYGKFSQLTVEAFGNCGYHFDDQIQLIQALKSALHPKAVVLVKGSRSMRMENVVEALKLDSIAS
jgi:UDP-N-acetylmuramoyl-tripeptide--D-alanyl-D-alanine ligase